MMIEWILKDFFQQTPLFLSVTRQNVNKPNVANKKEGEEDKSKKKEKGWYWIKSNIWFEFNEKEEKKETIQNWLKANTWTLLKKRQR